MNLQQIEQAITAMTGLYNREVGARDLLQSSLEGYQKEQARIADQLKISEQIQMLLTKSAEYARAQLKGRIETTVTAGIQAIFGNDDEFHVEMGTYREQPTANWRVATKGGVVDPEESDGGGISDTVSMALRLSLMEIGRPKPGGAVFLDESGKHVSKEYLPNMAEFIREYARTAGRQVFLVTHAAEMAAMADKSLSVKMKDNRESEVFENAE